MSLDTRIASHELRLPQPSTMMMITSEGAYPVGAVCPMPPIGAAKLRRRSATHLHFWQSGMRALECYVCGGTFRVPLANHENTNRAICSPACREIAMRHHRRAYEARWREQRNAKRRKDA